MVFVKRKYIFETRKTKTLRYFLNLCLLLIGAGIAYTMLCVGFVWYARYEEERGIQAFYKRPPDLISVYTGDAGRIAYGIKKAKEYNQSHIFITGVYSKNSVETLIAPLEVGSELDPNQLEIDYLARNTVENGISTLRYLREQKGIERVLVVSHDYHIPRIKHILDKVRSSSDSYEFYYSGIKTDYLDMRNIKILYKEVFKYARTYLFLLMWDQEISSENLIQLNSDD